VTFDPARLVMPISSAASSRSTIRPGQPSGLTTDQYRSAIFYQGEAQREAARKVMDELESSRKFKKRLATELVPASAFYKAEEYHQKYFEKHGVVCY
jgi:peptide methionine sulfoxide reductase MsrA